MEVQPDTGVPPASTKVMEACVAWLLLAVERAMKVVKEEKRQALVNVCLEVSYVKTS